MTSFSPSSWSELKRSWYCPIVFPACRYSKGTVEQSTVMQERHFYQLKVVGPVAVLGGLLQIALFIFLCGLTVVVDAPISL
jgi:hypothetical protein